MIFLSIAIASFAVQLFFQIWIWRGLRILAQKPVPPVHPLKPISVIIAAHNESENLPRLLKNLAGQTFPKEQFEIIIAADRCGDDTAAKARSFSGQFSRVTVLEIDHVPADIAPKKFALQQAISAAQYDHLVFLDADVCPTPFHLQTIGRYFAGGARAIVSLMRFRETGSFWGKFLEFEKLLSWCIAGAGVARRQPVISYGGNWAYSKSAFAEVGGFGDLMRSLSGDDDLLLQKFAALDLPMAMCLQPGGWVEMAPPASLKHFLRQRRRHFSAGKHYSFTLQVSYFFYHLSNLSLWVSAAFSLPGTALLLLKLLLDWGIIRRGSALFQVQLNFIKSIIYSFFYMLYNTLIGPLGHIGNIRW